MQRPNFRAALAALLFAGVGAVCQAAPSFHSALEKAVKAVQADADSEPKPYEWMLPSIFQAGLMRRGIFAFGGDTLASYEGRSFEMKQGQVTVTPTDSFQLFYGQQWILAKGHSSDSRFNGFDVYYGGRAVIKRPTATDSSAMSIQYEAIRQDVGVATTSTASAVYSPPQDDIFSFNYQDRRQNQYQFQFTDVEGADSVYARVYSLGFGQDLDLGNFLAGRYSADLVGESFRAIGVESNFEMRPIVFGALAVTPAPWCSLEADITVLPSGMPLAGGEFSAISGYALYEPGGIVNDLRSNFVFFASLRLMLHGKF